MLSGCILARLYASASTINTIIHSITTINNLPPQSASEVLAATTSLWITHSQLTQRVEAPVFVYIV